MLSDRGYSTWGINLRVNNRTETVGQAAQLVSGHLP
jgi:hypothetical protein